MVIVCCKRSLLDERWEIQIPVDKIQNKAKTSVSDIVVRGGYKKVAEAGFSLGYMTSPGTDGWLGLQHQAWIPSIYLFILKSNLTTVGYSWYISETFI